MDKNTGHILLKSDIDWLTNSATRLEQRLRSSAAKYVAGCISFAAVAVACGNLLSKDSEVNLSAIYESNKIFLGTVGVFLHLLGVVQLLSHSRD